MMDLRELAVPCGLDGGNRNVGVTVDGQLKDRAVISLRAAERTNDHMGVDCVGKMEELEREFLLGLESY